MALNFDFLNLKLALHLVVPWETFKPILIFLFFFVFELRTRTAQMDERSGEIHNAAYRTAA